MHTYLKISEVDRNLLSSAIIPHYSVHSTDIPSAYSRPDTVLGSGTRERRQFNIVIKIIDFELK